MYAGDTEAWMGDAGISLEVMAFRRRRTLIEITYYVMVLGSLILEVRNGIGFRTVMTVSVDGEVYRCQSG